MKRTHIMIAVFFACILSPNLLFPILKTTADEGTGENRSLAAFSNSVAGNHRYLSIRC